MGFHGIKTANKLRAGKQAETAPTTAFDWSSVEPDLIVNAIAAAAKMGGCLRFGLTRDGGSLAVGVYYGDVYYTDYIRSAEGPNDYLLDLIAGFEDVGPAPKGNKRPKK